MSKQGDVEVPIDKQSIDLRNNNTTQHITSPATNRFLPNLQAINKNIYIKVGQVNRKNNLRRPGAASLTDLSEIIILNCCLDSRLMMFSSPKNFKSYHIYKLYRVI